MDDRLKQINKYVGGMADIVLTRTLLSRRAVIIFNDIIIDQYHDSQTIENCRIEKNVMISKSKEISFVQELDSELLEDNLGILPWSIYLTNTDLPRNPRKDDNIIVEDIKYTIAKTKPLNRDLSALLVLYIYPERTDFEDLDELNSALNDLPL